MIQPFLKLFNICCYSSYLKDEAGSGFSPKAAYIFIKQLEEADAIVINRIDELNPTQLNELLELVAQKFPGVPVLKISAKIGTGIEELAVLLDQKGGFGRKILEIDYDIYAEGEAELGWLNSTLQLQSYKPLDVDAILLDVIEKLRKESQSYIGEVVKVKIIKTKRTFTMYINDIFYKEKECGKLYDYSNQTIFIGVANPYSFEENKFWFNGEILEVKIYHNSIETDDDLYLWFDFERNSKFKTFDKSGNGNHGELYETEEFKYEKHIEFNKLARPAKII